jgi:hypothetical protein
VDVTLNVFMLAAIAISAFAAGFILMGVLAASGRATFEEEYRLNRCKGCCDDAAEDVA